MSTVHFSHVKRLEKLRKFVNGFETEGRQDIWSRDAFGKAYRSNPSIEWSDKRCTMRAIKFVKSLASDLGSSFELPLQFNDGAKLFVGLHRIESKHVDTFRHFLNEFQDEGAKEYWRNYVYQRFMLSSSVDWTDTKSTMRAASYLKIIQYINNADWGGMDEDKNLENVFNRRNNYFRWLEGEILACNDPLHQASKSLTTVGLLRIKFGNICDELSKVLHPALFTDGAVFHEFSQSVQRHLMNVTKEPLGWGRSNDDYSVVEANYKDTVRNLDHFTHFICSVSSKQCVDPNKFQSILTRADDLVFSILHMAHRNDVHQVESIDMEKNIFHSSSDMLSKLSPKNQDTLQVYLEVLSAHIDIIMALKQPEKAVHLTGSGLFLILLQATKNHARILGEILEFPIMDLITGEPDGFSEQVETLLRQGIVSHEAAPLVSYIPPNHVELSNLLNKLTLIKGAMVFLEVHNWKANLSSFGGDRAVTIREAFNLMSRFFKTQEVYMGDREKFFLELISSFLGKTGSSCELSEDQMSELSLSILKLYKAEALFMVLRHNTMIESKQEDQIICREGGGVGHIRSECPAAQKRLGKSFVATWSDDDDDHTNKFVSFDAKVIESESLILSIKQVNLDPCFNMDVETKGTHVDSDFFSSSYSMSDSEGLSSNVEDIRNAYDEIYETWLKEVETNKGLTMEKKVLDDEVDKLKIEVVIFKSDMACVTKRLEATESTMNDLNSNQGLGYVKEVQKQEKRKSGVKATTIVNSYVSTCFLLLFCWCFAVSICFKAQFGDTWYSNSSCSRHMTRTPKVLNNGVPSSGYVAFGDGKMSRVIGKGEFDIKGFPMCLDDERMTVDDMDGFEKADPDHVKTSLPVTELMSSDVEMSSVFGATSEVESEIDTSTSPMQQRTQEIVGYHTLAGFGSHNEVLDCHVITSTQFVENTKPLDSATFERVRQHLGVCRD